MLFRREENQVIAVSQPAHAWVSGQLARVWGNTEFGTFEPWEEVCLGAEQHDIGWLDWERQPRFNQATGLPYSFTELPSEQHIGVWTNASSLAASYNLYAALLVSLHGTGLYERFGSARGDTPAHVAAQEFIEREKRFQQHAIARLEQDARYTRSVSDDVLTRNRGLIATWDWLSLLICGGFEGTKVIERVPAASGEQKLTLVSRGIDRIGFSLDPWPFRAESVTLVFEGRRFPERMSSAEEMRAILNQAPPESFQIELHATR